MIRILLSNGKQTIRQSIRAFSTTKQDEVTRDLFHSFCHPGTDDTEPYLSVSDIEKLLSALGERPTKKRVEQLVRDCDVDGNGTIDYSEFLNGKSKLLQHDDSDVSDGICDLDLDHIVSSFGTLDKNGDGFVCEDDLTGLLSTTGGHMSRDAAKEIIKIGDEDGDKKLCIMEFLNFARNPKYSDISWQL
jgi:calcium-binding protein CML